MKEVAKELLVLTDDLSPRGISSWFFARAKRKYLTRNMLPRGRQQAIQPDIIPSRDTCLDIGAASRQPAPSRNKVAVGELVCLWSARAKEHSSRVPRFAKEETSPYLNLSMDSFFPM